jgi:hypothetical protein
MHIIDQINNESEKLYSLNKEYIKKEDINTLEKIKSSKKKLCKLLQDYDKLLKEEAEIYGDLPNILSEKDKKMVESTDGRKKSRSKRSSKKSKRSRNKNKRSRKKNKRSGRK